MRNTKEAMHLVKQSSTPRTPLLATFRAATRMVALTAILLGCAFAFLATTATTAHAQPMDFSDTDDPKINWPFTVIDFHLESDEYHVYQHTRVQESPDEVFNYMRDKKREKDEVDGYIVRGVTKQASGENLYVINLYKGNQRYLVKVRRDGGGSILVLDATPSAMVTGFFKRSLYGYRLGGGITVRCSRWDMKDE